MIECRYFSITKIIYVIYARSRHQKIEREATLFQMRPSI